jgi:DeoR/GlpR family transcriptional regulator of sugar metabolism
VVEDGAHQRAPRRRRARLAPARRVIIGGRLLKDALVTVGATTVDALREVRADACVLGICSLQPELGVTATDHEEAHVTRAMVHASAEVIALATADNLRTMSPWFVAPLAEVTHLVTDAQDDLVAEDAHAGVSVVRA